jgi:hypothetical protein
VPDAAARAKGDQLTADGVLALKPGAQVSLSVNLPNAKPDEVQSVTKKITDALAEQGFVVAAGAPISVEATIEDAGKETVTYRNRPGFFGGGEKVEVQKHNSIVTIKENGQTLWTATGHYGAPRLLRHKDGQTIQEAVNEQKGNPIAFFDGLRFPKHIARHEAGGAYGSSKLAP